MSLLEQLRDNLESLIKQHKAGLITDTELKDAILHTGLFILDESECERGISPSDE